MSILFDDASTEYLEIDATPVTAPAFTLACWFMVNTDTPGAYSLISLADKDVDNHYNQIVVRNDLTSDPILATSRNSSTTPSATTSTGITPNVWHHACGVWSATNSRAAYIDGGSKGTDTVTCAQNDMDRVSIGRLGDSSPGRYMSGRIAEAAIWNVALTDAEVATLALGISPLQVRKASLVAYYRLININDLNDLIGTGDVTAYNTPASAEHAPVMYFNGAIYVPETVSAGVASNSERNAVITGKLTSNSERDAVVTGVEGSNSERNSVIHGKLNTNNVIWIDWIQKDPAGAGINSYTGVASDSDGSNLIVGVDNGRLYTSSDGGVNWTERQPAGDIDKRWYSVASDSDGSNLIVGELNGRLYTSLDSGVNWTERQPAGSNNKIWEGIASDSDGSNLIVGAYSGRLYTSSNGGVDWTERQPAGNFDKYWQSVASDSDGSNLIAGAHSGRLYTSSNGGVDWTERQPAGNFDLSWIAVASSSDGSHLIACVRGGEIYISSDSGANWTEVRPDGNSNKLWQSAASNSDGSNLIVCTGNSAGGRIYISKDSGTNWFETQPAGNFGFSWMSVSVDSNGVNFIVSDWVNNIYIGVQRYRYERLATLTGILGSNSERNAVISGIATTNSERNAVVTGKLTANSERSVVITGGVISTSERSAVITGKLSTNSERNAVIVGKTSTNSERNAVITGKLTSSSERDAIIIGGIISTSERSAIITGKSTSNSERSAVIIGGLSTSNERDAVITGKLGANSERDAVITGKSATNSECNAVISGKLSSYSERNVVITGKSISNSERNAVITGGVISTSERNAVITGKSSTFSERNAKIKVEGGVSSERFAVISGFSITNSERNAVISGSIEISSERNAIIHGRDIDNSERNAIIHGKDFANSERDAVIRGKDFADSERNAKIHGKDIAGDERNAVIRGKLTAYSERDAVIHGKALATSERYCKLIGEGTICTSGRLGTRTYIREKKTYAQVSDKNGNYLGIIPEIIDVQFQNIMNGGSANMVISIPEKIEDIETNQLYNGGNQVVIWVQDRDAPAGVKIYCGSISIVKGTVRGNAEYVELGIEGYTSEFEKTPYIDSEDASIQQTAQLPSDVFKSIVDKYRAFRNNPHMNYSASSVDSIGANYLITYPFNHKNCFEAINSLMESCPIDWYWYLDNDGILYFKQISDTPDHLFTFSRDIVDEFTFQKSYGNVRTGILFWNNQSQTASDRTRLIYRQSAVDEYDKNIQIVSDGNITRWDTLARNTEKYLDGSSQPLSAVGFIIFDNNSGIGYDIESIKPGDTCRILNLSGNLDIGSNLVITTTEYHLDYIKIIVEDKRQFVTRQLMDMNRRLSNQEYSEASYKVGIGTYEMGLVTVNKDYTSIAYKRKYQDPILIACMNTYNDLEEGNVICRITGDEDEQVIEARVIETPENTDDHANESIAYMLMETGAGYLPSGIYFEAGKVEENDGNFSSVAFSKTFVNTPVILCSYQTSDGHYCNVRIQNRTTAGFQAKLQNAQGDSTTVNGTIYWIALNMASDNTFLPIDLEVPADVQGISDGWKTVTWTQTWSNNPLVFHQIQTYADTDPCSSRIKELGTTTVKVVCEEDKNGDPEQNHNVETVALIGFPYNNSDGIT